MSLEDPFADDVPPYPVRNEEASPKEAKKNPFLEQTDETKEEEEVISADPDDSEMSEKTRKLTVVDNLAENLDIVDVSQIVVCEPTERKDERTGILKWVEYKVITEKTDGSQCEVFRRYNHFLWLRQLLWKDHRGIIVPPLPEKKNFGRFDASFVERRRRRLEQFLNRLAIHPYLKEANAFHVFLSIQESDMFDKAVKGDSSSLADKAGSLYNNYRTTKQKVLNKGSPGETEDDQECARMKLYGKSLEKIASNMEKSFLTLDNESRSLGYTWDDTAASLQAISEFEEEEGNERSAFCLGALKETCEKVGALNKDPESLSTFTTIKLRDLFDDFSKYGKAIKECVEGREQVYYQHLAEQSTLKNRRKTLDSLENSNYVYNKESRVNDTQSKIVSSEEKVEELESALNSVTDRLQTEVQAFQKTKPARIEEKLMNFADFQIEHIEQMVEYWKELKAKLS